MFRSLRPAVPKYRHHKGSGQAFVQVQGHRYYLGKWGTPESKERYARFIAELAALPSVAPPPAPQAPRPELTVVELAAAYLDFAEGYYVKDGRPTGHLPVIKRMLALVKELYGHTSAVEFGPLALRAIQQKVVELGNARKTVNHMAAETRRMFKWAASHELIPATTYQALTTVPGLKKGRSAARETEPVQPVPDSVIEATLPHLPPVVADMVRFERLTGCRPGEVCQLRPMDVDRSGDIWIYCPASHKTEHYNRGRLIHIGPRAQAILRPYLLRPSDAYCFSPIDSEAKRHAEMREKRRSRVQPSQQNRRKPCPKRQPKANYTPTSYRRAIIRGVEKANEKAAEDAAKRGVNAERIPPWHPNQLRHSAATEIRHKYGLEAAQVALGHATADVTQIYACRDYALAASVMREIG